MNTIVWLGFVLGALSAVGKVFHTKSGSKVILECGIKTYRSSLKWHHGTELIIYVDMKGISHRGQAAVLQRSRVRPMTNLEIKDVKKEDAGEFTCNVDENRQVHRLLVVSVWVSPHEELEPGSKAVLHCEVDGLSPGSTVQWKRPGGSPHTGPGPVELAHVALSDAGIWACTFSYEKETYSEYLEVKVKELKPETTTSSPTQRSIPTCPTCGTNSSVSVHGWWMWVAVGVGCLVVVLLIVFIIVLCKRNRRRKKRLQMMKNGRQPQRPKKYCQCNRPTAAAKPQQGRRKGKPSALPLQPLLME